MRIRHARRRHGSNSNRIRIQSTVSVRSFADRQYSAGSFWSARCAADWFARRDWFGSERTERDGGPAVANLFSDRSVLVDLGLCGFPRHAGNLARDFGSRRLFCGAAISYLKFSWPVVGGCSVSDHFNRGAGNLFELLATQTPLAA